jgi:ribosomal protein L25 (general stress protein Ctc)
MANPNLIKKLLIKPGMRLAVLNAPAGYLDELGPLPEGAQITHDPNGALDFVQLFIKNRGEYERLGAGALRAVKPDGLLWVCYPKKSSGVQSDLDRDVVWKMLEPTGLRPVTQIAIDEVWSALRFRPVEKVKT